ncbi:MAG: DNA-3-methyladenine glycosylase I [Bacilli bacterium]|nr:DNA-3-methyladenine glycosylase I [Bacilli bacterium]
MRCKWVNIKNPLYVKYHDEEWGKPCHDEHMLYELFILETFQAGLSWECILNKREFFREAYDNFNLNKVINYDENKINELLNNKKIIRNRYKIRYSILNSIIYKNIVNEYGSFSNYIWGFSNNKAITYNDNRVTSELSDRISKDLVNRGMKFVGSVTIFSYLQAIGIINSHDKDCDFK